MRLFVTGGTGFIGSHFINAATAAGHELVGLRLPGTIPRIPVTESVQWIEGDLSSWRLPNQNKISEINFTTSALVHFAAFGVSPQPCTWAQAFQFNVLDSISLFQRAIDSGVSRIIICGSCFEYGAGAEGYDIIPSDAPLKPIGAYAASKAALSVAASSLCREYNIELIILRLFTVFGEGQHESNFWPSLRKAALSGEDFSMTSGEQIRDFIAVEEVAHRFLEAATNNYVIPGQPLIRNVGTGQAQSLLQFAQFWWNNWNAEGILLAGCVPYRKNEIMRYVPDIS